MTAAPPAPLVLWDLDGTLVTLHIARASVDLWRARLHERFAPFGYAGPWSPLLPSLEAALAAVAGARGAPAAPEVYAALDLWESEALGGVTVLEGAAEAWLRLAAGGVEQAVVTNNGPTVAARALEALRGWAASAPLRGAGARDRPWVEPVAVVVRGPGLRAKPAADPLERACDLAGAAGWAGAATRAGRDTGVVVVGDRDDDARAAAALGERGAARVVFVRAHTGGFGDGAGDERARLLEIGLDPAWLWPGSAATPGGDAP